MKYTMHGQEEKDALAWAAAHKCKQHWLKPLVRKEIWYCFGEHGGIGTSVKIMCSCGEEKDVTDVSTW